jgi:hypothetical protein
MVSTVRALMTIFLLAAGPLALAAPKALAPASPVTRATVEARLRNYQPDPAAWRALGGGVDQRLVEIGGDPKVEPLLRSRALSTLAWFPGPATRKLLESTVEGKAASSDPGDRLLVRKAAVALGWLGGVRVPALLAPLLESQDAEVRLDAAVALGLTRLPVAADLLRDRLAVETTPAVKTQISRQIQLIDDARIPALPGKR